MVQLPIDFKLKDVEEEIVYLWEDGGTVASDSKKLFHKWDKKINPKYPYEHAKYSANRFLEGLRRELCVLKMK